MIPRSLSSRIALLTGAAALLAALLIGAAAYHIVGGEVRRLTSLRVAAAENATAHQLHAVLERVSISLKSIADNPIISNALVDSQGRDVYLRPALDSFVKASELKGDVALLDYRGRLVGAVGAPSPVIEQNWLKSVIEMGRATARLESSAQGWDVVIAEPVIYPNNGSAEGVLVYILPLSELTWRRQENMVHQHLRVKGQDIESQDPPTTLDFRPEWTSARMLPLSEPLSQLHIELHTHVDGDQAEAPLRAMRTTILWVALGVAGLVAMLVGGVGARVATAPLTALAEAVENTSLQQPDWTYRPPHGAPEEVVSLADAFAALMARLERAYAQIEGESRALVRNAERVANIGTWRWRPMARTMEWSDNIAHILNLGDATPSLAAMRDAIDPAAAAALTAVLRDDQPSLAIEAESREAPQRFFRFIAERKISPDGAVVDGVLMDVTALRAVEHSLRDKEAALRAILDNFPFMVWLKDLDGRFVAVNDVLAKTCGRDHPDQLIGLTDFDICPRELAEGYVADDLDVLKTGRRLTVEEPLPSATERRWIETYKTPVRTPEGRIIGTVGFARDVTERMQAQQTLKNLSVELERSNAELARSNTELEQFAYVASHDLRQPLRVVSSYLGLLRHKLGGQLDEEGETFLRFAVDGAKRMDNLILSLLAYSRVGRDHKPPEPTPLAEILAEARQDLAVAIQSADARITLQDDAPPVLLGRRIDLLRLFENLLGNAIKYTPPDRKPEIFVGWRDEGDAWRLWVRDNGMGIAPKDFERAFGVFQRLVGKTQHEGAGVGLAICKKIVEQHGGRIWIESELGQGACFLLTLPKTPPGTAA